MLLDLTRDRVDPTGAWPVAGAAAVARFISGELDYFRRHGRPVVHAVTLFDDTAARTATGERAGQDAEVPREPGLSALWGQFLYFWPLTGAQALTRFMRAELAHFWDRGRPAGLATRLFEKLGPVHAPGTPRYNRRGTPGAEIAEPFTPAPGEIVIEKPADSAFLGTPLWEQLFDFGVAQVTLVGLESHTSVLATALDAAARGLQVAVPDTCVTASDPELHRAALRIIQGLQVSTGEGAVRDAEAVTEASGGDI